MDGHRVDELPDERTALLGVHNTTGPNGNGIVAETELPAIKPAAELVLAQGIRFTSLDDLAAHELSTRTAQAAFTLVVLLFVLHESKCKASEDVWETWLQEQTRLEDVHELEQQVMYVWNNFLHADGSGKDVKEVLWMSFPVEDNKAPQLRVVDFVSHGLAPDSLFTHRMLFLSYEHTWKHGHYGIEEPNESLSHRALSRLDSLASPRVLHLIELAFKLLYLFLLGSYVMTPPRKPVIVDDPPSLGFRGVCILLYTAASLIRRWSMSTLPSSLVFLSFVSHITAEPCPGDIAFDVLLLALIWHLLALHLPDSPSPLLVLSVSDSLPLAALFQRAVTHAIRPAVLFFLPIFFVSFYMLSLSLSDTFLRATASFTDPLPSAPIETRTSLLTLCLLVLVLFSASLCILTVTAASQGFSATQAIDPWDRFGTGVGRQARRSFFHAVHHHYSDRYYFPPPFNLLFIVVVQVPACAIWLASRGNARSCRARMEKIVWRATVGPFALLFAGTSLWGLWR